MSNLNDKDLCVRVYLSASDWLALRDLAEHHGVSQSAFMRQMLRHAIEHAAWEKIRRERDEGGRDE